jgi:hypothetical protein
MSAQAIHSCADPKKPTAKQPTAKQPLRIMNEGDMPMPTVDRNTIPGAEPEELMALKLPILILPGHTDFHATSCTRYLEEGIPGADYWDVHLESQPPDHIRDRILDFLATHAGAGVHA